jgi:hypothetical protein
MSYIVEIPNGGSPYWLAPWTGDPGRTSLRENAQVFPTQALAESVLKLAQKRFGKERKSLSLGMIIPA